MLLVLVLIQNLVGDLSNAKASAELITDANSSAPESIIEENSLSFGATYSFDVTVTTAQKLMATICWTDVAGNSHDSQLNSSDPALTNDLDLRIIKGTETFYPWKLQLSDVTAPAIKGDNIVDTVERVEVENALGTYTIQVSSKGFLIGGSQAYSLIVSGFDSSLSTDDFQLTGVGVYPNPAADVLNIESVNTAIDSYEIFDIQGRKVISQKVNGVNNTVVSLQSLNSGVYFVKIHSQGGTYTQKFLKK